MKFFAFLSFAILLLVSPVFAQLNYNDPDLEPDNTRYTVIARNGLNLRQAPNGEAKIIKSLLPNTIVSILDDELTPQSLTIGDRKGYWQRVAHQTDTGYVFSVYLFLSSALHPSSNTINTDYRILHTGEYFPNNSLNYDPTLHWYALIRNAKYIEMRPVKVEVKINKEMGGNENNLMGYEEYKIEAGLPVGQHILIGVRQLLRTTRFPQPEALHNPPRQEDNNYNWDAWQQKRFLRPETTLVLPNKDNSMLLFATDSVKKIPYSEVPIPWYRLDATISGEGITPSTTNLSSEMNFFSPSQRNLSCPTLEFVGDLNADGFDDLIYYSWVNSEGCAGSWYHYVFLTESHDGKVSLKKRAELGEGN